MKLEQEALGFIRELTRQYFEERNIEALLSAMMEETSWIGTGAGELCRSLVEAKAALVLEAMEYGGNFMVTETDWNVSHLTETVCVVYGKVTATPSDQSLADQHNRVTAVCVRTDTGMKLAHLHFSNPDADQSDGRFYVKRSDLMRREFLLRRAEKTAAELRDRNAELETLAENIPGGVHQCKCDEGLTLLNMSRSFFALVGYTPDEIEMRYHNHFIEMLYPDDRPRVTAEMTEQLSHGDTVELEYRIKCSDGRLVWILDHGKRATALDGTQTFYCILLDITEQKEAREDLRLLLERHQIIMDQTTDIIFEWDILTDRLTFSSNWRKKFGYDPISENISSKIPLSHNIHPEDMPAFVKIMNDTAAGVPYSETEFRIRNVCDVYIWNRIRATTQYDSAGKPIKAVGVILDIDSDKKQKQRLLERAQRDALTNLYNKTAVRELAERRMREGDRIRYHALLIIDVDDFKQVNDTYGHLCGDSLLTDVAGTLCSQFRSGDIVGRIGGDEFLVYLPEIAGKKETAAKVEALLGALHTLRPGKDAPPISCSIGVALFPQKVADYLALCKCADTALYQIKARGKNGFLFYDPTDCGNERPGDVPHSAVGGIDFGNDKL
ncbi:MAG: diguanylate cyclase [Lachnospiraceae bacterium]|nr:diguanylate cyclase [Lachnospiraceae bacterium]